MSEIQVTPSLEQVTVEVSESGAISVDATQSLEIELLNVGPQGGTGLAGAAGSDGVDGTDGADGLTGGVSRLVLPFNVAGTDAIGSIASWTNDYAFDVVIKGIAINVTTDAPALVDPPDYGTGPEVYWLSLDALGNNDNQYGVASGSGITTTYSNDTGSQTSSGKIVAGGSLNFQYTPTNPIDPTGMVVECITIFFAPFDFSVPSDTTYNTISGPAGAAGADGPPGADGDPGPSNLFIQEADPGASATPYIWFELNMDGTIKTVWSYRP